jgi:hypothetical protein
VLELLIKLYKEDDFSVRGRLIDHTVQMIGVEETLNAIHIFEMLEEQETEDYQKFHYHIAILSLARQTYNPQLFEKTMLKRQPDPGGASILDIAEVYLASGEPNTALEWMGKIPEGDIFMADKRDELLLQIYKGYPHAAKYLRKLNALSEKIEDWENLGNHLGLLTWLEEVHGKKSSFWRHYRPA